FRVQGTVGFQIDYQLVEVGTLLDASVLDHIGNPADRAESGIQLQATDAAAFFLVALTRFCRLVATATPHGQTHVQRAIGSQIGNDVVAIDDLDIVIQLDVRCGDDTSALLGKAQGDFIATVQLDGQAFQVEQDFDDVFLNTFDGAVLMKHTVD